MKTINAVGGRKTSTARVYLQSGEGNITINKKKLDDYFPIESLRAQVKQPLEHIEGLAQFNVKVNVAGGGFKGQAEAIKLAIARALCEVSSDHRPVLKKEGCLRRDPRRVERKKCGQKKARKKFQFSKR